MCKKPVGSWLIGFLAHYATNRIFQIPPDVVVKFQTVDIVEVI
jgi:hypothetical protein